MVGRKKAAEKGNNIIVLDEAETNRWKEAAASVVDSWVKEIDGKGMDGQALVDDAQALLKKNAM